MRDRAGMMRGGIGAADLSISALSSMANA